MCFFPNIKYIVGFVVSHLFTSPFDLGAVERYSILVENRAEFATCYVKPIEHFLRSISYDNGNKWLRLSDENRMWTHSVYQHLQIDSCVLSRHCVRMNCIKWKTKVWKVCCTVVVWITLPTEGAKANQLFWFGKSKECQCRFVDSSSSFFSSSCCRLYEWWRVEDWEIERGEN